MMNTLLTLLLSLFITGCVWGSNLTVWQTPKTINTTEGQQVNISCHFTVKSVGSIQHLRIEWLINNHTVVKHGPCNISALKLQNSDSINHTSVLHIPAVRLNHSGIYYCRVFEELPKLGEKIYGPGTELRVDVEKSAGPDATFPAVIVIGASLSVLITVLVTSVIYCIYRGLSKRPEQQREGEMTEESDPDGIMTQVLYSFA